MNGQRKYYGAVCVCVGVSECVWVCLSVGMCGCE